MTLSDSELIQAIRKGDEEALYELLLRYRAQAVRWARAVVLDSHLAEDIAQEALLKAIAKLEQLQDTARFASWLRQAVRRHALNRLRRDRREVPVSETHPESSGAKSVQEVVDPANPDPLDWIARQESLQELWSVAAMSSLSPRSRTILHELAAEADTNELMERFALTRGNLYNIISRSRSKAGEERFRAALEAYLAERRLKREPASALLSKPVWPRPYSLFGVALHAALQYEPDATASCTETMGVTGEAFRLSVAENCHWRGISTYDWTFSAQRAIERLGLKAAYFARKRHEPIATERNVHLLRLIHDSIGRGVPVVIWNLFINEFGLLYGYDDRSQILYYYGFRKRAEPISYRQLGRAGEELGLFALAAGPRAALPASDGMMITAIVKHARGEEPPVPGFAYGLKGYLLWRDAAERGTLDTLGHAYQVAIMCEAREHAVAYLQILADRAATSARRNGLAAAGRCYAASLQALQRLCPSFPYGYGAGHAERGPGGRLSDELTAAFQAESEAAGILENL